MNNTPKSLFGSTQETLSKFFNINKKVDENFVSQQSDVIISEKEKNITPQKEKIKSTQKEITYIIPEIIPEITEKYIIEPTDAIPINYEKAQFYPNYNENDKKLISEQIDEKLNSMNIDKLRTDYKKIYTQVATHNEKIDKKNKI